MVRLFREYPILTKYLPTLDRHQAISNVLEMSMMVVCSDIDQSQRRAALMRQTRYSIVAVAGGTEATAGGRHATGETGIVLLLDGYIDGWQKSFNYTLTGEVGSACR